MIVSKQTFLLIIGVLFLNNASSYCSDPLASIAERLYMNEKWHASALRSLSRAMENHEFTETETSVRTGTTINNKLNSRY